MSFSTKDGSIGRIAVVDHPEICINQSVALLRPNNMIEPHFLKYLLQAPHYQHRMTDDADGTTIFHIYITRVDKMQVAVPPISEQRRILSVLQSLDDKIELNRCMNETLEAIARAVFKSWFVDFDPVQAKAEGREPAGMDTETAGLFPDRFEERELGMVPKGWETKLLGQITCYINRGIQPKYIDNDGITVINQKCIRDHQIDWTKARRHDPNFRPVNGRELQIGDLLINSTGVGTLGRVAQILCLYERAIVDSHVTIVRADPKIITWNTLGLMLFTRQAEIEDIGEGTTGQTELSRERLKSLKLLVPSISAQKLFDKVTLPLRNLIISNEIQMQALACIRDVLLPELLSGEIRVKVAGE